MFKRHNANNGSNPGGANGSVVRLAATLGMALGVCIGASGVARAANLVTNGGFELVSGSPSSPDGWTIAGDGILVDQFFPNSGFNDMAFSANSDTAIPGVLSQSIATVPGTVYMLSFALWDESGLRGNTFTAMFGGRSFSFTGDMTPTTYVVESFTLQASDITTVSTVLSFTGINNTSDWNLDDVSIVAASSNIPEPALTSLFGMATLSGLILARRRRPAALRA